LEMPGLGMQTDADSSYVVTLILTLTIDQTKSIGFDTMSRTVVPSFKSF